MVLKTIASLLAILIQTSCSMFGAREVEIISKPVEIEIIQPVLPRPLDLKEPRWYVVSEANIDTFLEDIAKESGGQMVFVAMSIQDYELMAYNMQEIKRYVRELGQVIVYYRNVTIKTPEGSEPGVGVGIEVNENGE